MGAVQPPLVDFIEPRVVACEVEAEDTGENYELNFDRGGSITRQTNMRLLRKGKKYCPKCERVLPTSEFVRDWTPEGELEKWCTECKLEDDRRHQALRYKRNADEIKRGRARLNKLYTDLLGGRCGACGSDETIFLEFHHIDPKRKKYRMSYLLNPGLKMTWERLVEADKCGILCDRCHKRLEWGHRKATWVKVDYGYRLIDWQRCD